MELRALGTTGLEVSCLGLGAGVLGDDAVTDGEAERLVHAAVDLGVRLIDTARSYGGSEVRLGRFLGPRRQSIVLSTKLGYGVFGAADWTADAVARGVDEALVRLRTDVIDVVHLHSCGLEVLEHGDVIEALERARDAGKLRVAAYSGENRELDWALASGRFGVLQHSVSLFDAAALTRVSPAAAARGVGVIGKRALGNAPWRYRDRPVGHEADKYWDRYRALALDPTGLPWPELAIRFAAHAPGVSTVLTGTAKAEHLAASVEAVGRGPLSAERMAAIEQAHARCGGADWPGVI